MSAAAQQFSITVMAIIVIVDLWAITSVLRRKSSGKKAAWLIGIIFFAVVGWIVWNNAGPRYTKKNLASTKHNKV
jgi:hypothetical protein